jgi:hypothetical protein
MLGFYSNNARKEVCTGQQGPSSSSTCPPGHKKIKDYSYNPVDRIGKGFSSIVYKGINDNTSNKFTWYGYHT